MVSVENILAAYEAANIAIAKFRGNIRATTIEMQEKYGVFVNPAAYETTIKLKGALAHELGHCETGATHAVYSPYDLIEKHEHWANKSAWFRWMPPEKFQEAFQTGHTEVWEVAEWFAMPEDMVRDAWKYYKDNGLL